MVGINRSPLSPDRHSQPASSISCILIALDAGDRVTRWNAVAEQTFGLAADSVVGRRITEAGIPWDWPPIFERMLECRAGRDASRLSDVRYRRPGDGEGILSLTVSEIVGSDDDHAGFLLLGSDITDRRLLEMQLAQAQKLESIGQLAAGIAHELNTPIQFVGDNMRFLESAFRDLLSLLTAYRQITPLADAAGGDLREALARVRKVEGDVDVDYLMTEIPLATSQSLEGVGRVATIVRAMKEFAHHDQSKEKVFSDVNQALVSTLTVARNEIKDVAEVETDFGDLPPVLCLPGELNQVFLNLIVNAAQAIADRVKNSGARGVIGVRTVHKDGWVTISISDTGGGIPEAIQHKIFDPFFTTKEVGRGSGQGLTIARNVVVDKHGGTLSFATEVGRGTTFHVGLPLGETPG